MKRLRWIPVCCIAVLLSSLPSIGGLRQGARSFQPQWRSLAELLVERMSLRTGERVLLLGQPGRFAELTSELRSAVRLAGATDLGALSVLSQ
ncbi:MAG: hypothetical protein V3T83_20595, partial [Acidobacteriota bacterium]